jgi:hypothetical protein
MVDPVATIVAARRMQHDITRLQQRLSIVGQEVATGMKADVSGELRGRTSILLGFRDAHARTERYLESGATLTMRLDTMQLAMSAIRDTSEPIALETLAAVGREVTSRRYATSRRPRPRPSTACSASLTSRLPAATCSGARSWTSRRWWTGPARTA